MQGLRSSRPVYPKFSKASSASGRNCQCSKASSAAAGIARALQVLRLLSLSVWPLLMLRGGPLRVVALWLGPILRGWPGLAGHLCPTLHVCCLTGATHTYAGQLGPHVGALLPDAQLSSLHLPCADRRPSIVSHLPHGLQKSTSSDFCKGIPVQQSCQ